MLEISSMFPGFRFSPTDQELLSHYLKRKIEGLGGGEKKKKKTSSSNDVIPEVEICKYEPWDLPAKSIVPSDHEWFFFSPTDRKYPNGSQARRATEVGFWKATGKERVIKSGSNIIGTKRTLVFHIGRAPKGERTDWIMHEYCIKGHNLDKLQDSFVVCRIRKNSNPACDAAGQSGVLPANDAPSTVFQADKEIISGFPNSANESSAKQTAETCSSQLDSNINQENINMYIFMCQGCDPKSADDDCFLDILNDDIIKLDDTSFPETTLLLSPVLAENSKRRTMQPVETCTSQIHPLQGTAHRRIRLGEQRSGQKGDGEEDFVERTNQEDLQSCNTKLSLCTIKCQFVYLAIVVVLLVLFLLGLGQTL
ncbi:hypothetical protein GIB67_013697 [Kingdonia uniflora]|uniref:NAC domain-containing protein n=1 Tax=Kingdonia uniflora TaxID=39325 RepID=A0A7J7NPY4_9MAGN|nr:hypothetical protein GIB67_013697 [Kingdonia uniflora]